MCFASEPAWKKHLFLLHGVRRPEAEDYCEDVLAAARASKGRQSRDREELRRRLSKYVFCKDFEVEEEGESGSGFLAVEDEMLAEYEEEAEQERGILGMGLLLSFVVSKRSCTGTVLFLEKPLCHLSSVSTAGSSFSHISFPGSTHIITVFFFP